MTPLAGLSGGETTAPAPGRSPARDGLETTTDTAVTDRMGEVVPSALSRVWMTVDISFNYGIQFRLQQSHPSSPGVDPPFMCSRSGRSHLIDLIGTGTRDHKVDANPPGIAPWWFGY